MDRLMSKVKKEENGCWIWRGRVRSDGYGEISVNGKGRATHRVAHEELIGPIPEGLQVCHKCDNRQCINPDHLFLGTQKDNQQDMARKGRGVLNRKGEAHPAAKLTNDQYEEIRTLRKAGVMRKELAIKYNVSPSAIRWIAKRASRLTFK
jgi:hypothetical protein